VRQARPMRRRVVAAALIAVAALLPAAAPAAAPVRLTAAFGPGASLGAPAALQVGLHVDPSRRPAPVTDVRLLYPASLGVVSSGLGLAECRRPASDFVAVIVDGSGLDGCPPNAIMGYGTLMAEVRLVNGQVISEYATLALLSGPLEQRTIGLVVHIDGQRPFGGRLVLGGKLREAARPFGGAIDVHVPAIPSLQGVADVALVDLQLTVGGPGITYYERVRGVLRSYRPDGIVLPSRCPRGGFPFRVQLAFADGTRAASTATVPCPATASRR
jgi:hypothetical protein